MREIAKASLATCRSRYRASRRAKLILVPAAVAAAENVRGGLAQARPSGFFCSAPDGKRYALAHASTRFAGASDGNKTQSGVSLATGRERVARRAPAWLDP